MVFFLFILFSSSQRAGSCPTRISAWVKKTDPCPLGAVVGLDLIGLFWVGQVGQGRV